MADERLRELERRYRASGAVEDEAALLLARVRAGELSLDRLRLGAFAGHAGASAALAGELPDLLRRPRPFAPILDVRDRTGLVEVEVAARAVALVYSSFAAGAVLARARLEAAASLLRLLAPGSDVLFACVVLEPSIAPDEGLRAWVEASVPDSWAAASALQGAGAGLWLRSGQVVDRALVGYLTPEQLVRASVERLALGL